MKKYITFSLLAIQVAMMMGMESGSREKILTPAKREKVTRIMALSRARSTPTVSSSGEFLMKYENIKDSENNEDLEIYLNPKNSSYHRQEDFSLRDQACSPTARSYEERTLSFEDKSYSSTTNNIFSQAS